MLLVWMMRFWGSSILMQNDLVAHGYEWLHAQFSCPSSRGSFPAWWQREFWDWKTWTRWWGEWEPDLHRISSSSPAPVLSRVVSESVAGSNQQRGHRYLTQKENAGHCHKESELSVFIPALTRILSRMRKEVSSPVSLCGGTGCPRAGCIVHLPTDSGFWGNVIITIQRRPLTCAPSGGP